MKEEILKNLITLTKTSEKDFKILQEAAPELKKWSPAVVKMFYDTLFEYEHTLKVFKEGERPDREITLRDWYSGLLNGYPGASFWKHQWFVGLIHIKRDVSNHVMIAMMSRVQHLFLSQCLKEFSLENAQRIYGAFKRITDVVVGLIAEGYFENYLEAMESVLGIKQALINRMLMLEIDNMIKKARSKQ